MIVEIDKKRPEQIRETSIVQQTAFWSEVKRKQGIVSKAFEIKTRADEIITETDDSSYMTDDILVLLQPVDTEHHIAYVPYGPTLEPSEENRGAFLEELSESLRSYLPSKCIMIRYDLLWESPWAHDENRFDRFHNWIGPPEKYNQEFRFNFNTQQWNLKKANTDILPSNTIFIDLKKSNETLLTRMKPKTRYNIKLSERKGVHVRRVGFEYLNIWYDLYAQTALRNGIYLHDVDYFRTVLDTKANNTRSPAEVELLIAEVDNIPLAAMFLVISGRRATYLYGASSSTSRNYMATYALQWEAINRAKARACNEYDMFGVAPKPDPSHPMYGLYRFKSGFGGRMFHRMGCWDFPLDAENYNIFSASEFNSQGYHV